MKSAAAPVGLLGGCVRSDQGAAPVAAGAVCRWCGGGRCDEVRRRTLLLRAGTRYLARR